MIIVQNVSETYGKRTILDDVSFTVGEQDKIGLVGANGAGKTTLLKIITGEIAPEKGFVQRQRNIKIGYLPQDVVFPDELTAPEAAQECVEPLASVHRELRQLEQAITQSTGKEKRYMEVLGSYESLGGYSLSAKAEEILSKLGFSDTDFKKPVGQLSIGEKRIIHFAGLALLEPDVLLLDEPSNHLDVDAMEIVREFLEKTPQPFIISSHNRYLMDHTCNRIIEITDGKANTYGGNYTESRLQRQQRMEGMRTMYQAHLNEIRRYEKTVKTLRTGKFKRLSTASRKARQIRERADKMREKLVAPPSDPKGIALQFSGERSGDLVLAVSDLQKSYAPEARLIDNANFEIRYGDRVGIIGGNGSGKTTLLRCITGMEPFDEGKIRIGSNVRIGYFSQNSETLDLNNTVAQELGSIVQALSTERLYGILHRFLFEKSAANQSVGSLSGGERSRVQFIKIMLQEPNFLILDDPTSNLDIPARESIESALSEFSGTIMVASHDQYFLDLLVNRILELSDGRIKEYSGNYTSTLAQRYSQE